MDSRHGARSLVAITVLCSCAAALCWGDDDGPAAAASPNSRTIPVVPPPALKLVAEPAWSPRPARPAPPPAESKASTPGTSDESVKFSAEGKWDVAGYNNDQVIYTVFITNRDPRIIRCTTLLQGYFYEKGEKHSVNDRQSTTVFPQQRAQAGNWQGMDRKTGANFSVKCHPM